MNQRLKRFQERRFEAAALFRKGCSQAEVARRLNVSRQAVHLWHDAWQEGGKGALRGPGRTGPKPRLDQSQLTRLKRELLKGPLAHGYDTQLWTLPRMAKVIATAFAVQYHPAHVWKVLQRLGWSCQVPAVRARERDEAAVRRWCDKEWPRQKKAPGAAGKPLS